MGKGKGAIDHYIAEIAPGRIIFEVEGVTQELAAASLRLAVPKTANYLQIRDPSRLRSINPIPALKAGLKKYENFISSWQQLKSPSLTTMPPAWRLKLAVWRQNINQMKFDHAVRGMANPMELREFRRNIARAKTEARSREVAAFTPEQIASRSKIRARRAKR